MKTQYTTDFTSVITRSAHLVDLDMRKLVNQIHDSNIYEHEPFRFKGIVDSQDGTQLAAVTSRYALVQNMDVAQAVADALYDNGIGKTDIQRGPALYSNGKTRFDVKLPASSFTAPGDPSDLIPTIQVGNDYRGGGSLTLRVGLFRLLCTNGLVSFVRGEMIKMRHTGTVDYSTIFALILPVLTKMLAEVDDQKKVITMLAEAPAHGAWIDDLLKRTSDRYSARISGAMERNMDELGGNSWAVAQAISEVATHEMPTGWAAEQWATAAVQHLIADTKVQQGVMTTL